MNLEKLFYRIILGFYYIEVKSKTYKVIYPSFNTKYHSEILYDKIIEENKFDKRWLTENEIEFYLLTNNIWNKNKDKQLKDIEKSIEDTKIDLFQNFMNPGLKKNFKNELKNLQKKYTELQIEKKSMNHLGIQEHATTIKNEYIIMNCIYDLNNNLIFNPEKDDYNFLELQSFIKEIIDNYVSVNDIRLLVKSDLWKSFASSSIIEKDLINMNDDYKYLINFHKMYDNVKQHPDAPSEDIINDDDALDGWFIYQNRKSDKEKKKNSLLSKVKGDNGSSKPGQNATFIFTDSEEEAKAIYDLNGPKEKHFIEEVKKYSAENPGVRWEDIPIVRKQVEFEANKLKESNNYE